MARKAGQIIRRGDRKFLVRVFMGANPTTGKREYMNRTVHGTKNDAQRVLNSMLQERDLGTLREPDRVSLNDQLDKWLITSAAPRLRETTLESYTWLLERYIRLPLGKVMLHRLTPAKIQAVTADMQYQGLSPRTIKYAHSVLRSALDQAVKWGLINTNPADVVDLPKQEKRETKTMNEEEAQRFLAAAASDVQGALLTLLLATGLRPSEAVALQWPDLNLDNGELQVRRTLIRPHGGGWRFAEPKTNSSRRRITIPAGALEVLRKHRGQAFDNPYALIFCTIDGEPLHVGNLARRNFKRVMRAAGLEGFRLYDLRHTCANVAATGGGSSEDRK